MLQRVIRLHIGLAAVFSCACHSSSLGSHKRRLKVESTVSSSVAVDVAVDGRAASDFRADLTLELICPNQTRRTTDVVADGCHLAVITSAYHLALAFCPGAAYALAQQRRRDALHCWMGNVWQALSRLLPVRLHRWRRPGVRHRRLNAGVSIICAAAHLDTAVSWWQQQQHGSIGST